MEQFALFMFYVVDKNYTPIVLRVVCLWLCLFSIWLDTFGYRKAKTKIEISMHFKLFLSHSTLRCVFRTTWRAVLCGRVFSILWIFFLFTFSELFDKFGDDCWKIGWFIFEETHIFKFPTLICLIDLFTFGWLCIHACVFAFACMRQRWHSSLYSLNIHSIYLLVHTHFIIATGSKSLARVPSLFLFVFDWYVDVMCDKYTFENSLPQLVH